MAGFQGLQAMGANYLVHGLVGHNEKKPLAPKTPFEALFCHAMTSSFTVTLSLSALNIDR